MGVTHATGTRPGAPILSQTCGLHLSNNPLEREIPKIRYEWLREDGSWIPYPAEQQFRLLQADNEKEGKTRTVEIEVDSKTYALNFQTLVQKNIKSGTERPFRKVESAGASGPKIWSFLNYSDLSELQVIPFSEQECSSLEVLDIIRSFRQGCPEYDILKVQCNFNAGTWLLYHRLREDYRKRIRNFEERYLWHG